MSDVELNLDDIAPCGKIKFSLAGRELEYDPDVDQLLAIVDVLQEAANDDGRLTESSIKELIGALEMKDKPEDRLLSNLDAPRRLAVGRTIVAWAEGLLFKKKQEDESSQSSADSTDSDREKSEALAETISET